MTDYIKRADAIETVCRTRCGDKAKGCPAHSCLVIEEFDALPSADAVRIETYRELYEKYVELKHASADAVQGEWQKVEEQPYFRKHYDTVCCSVCRKKGNRKWNYCPNCGARMKGGEEE